jgi:hypothetical protein
MTQRERLHDYLGHLFSPLSIVRSAAGAGILQAEDTPGEWGLGAKGYGLRFANSYGQNVIRSTLLYGVSDALHEDNRYYRSGLHGAWPRLKYAIASSFVARHDDGSRHISISRISSTVATGFISRSWQPPSSSSLTDGVSSFGISFAVEIGFNVGREFLPFRFLHSRPPTSAKQSAT